MLLNKYNRVKGKQPDTRGVWCWSCDRQIVSKGKQCQNCGAVYGNKKATKSENIDFDLEFADPKLYNDCIE